jgi:glycosyltransferase involved in cell wall biosynthesis
LIFGVMAVWNEEDVIYATIRNLFEQGVDRVFVLDDTSDDATRSEARAAGADVILTTHDGVFRETGMTNKIQNLITEQTAQVGGDLWWMIADADEFPRGPAGRSIRELVEELPSWVDVVGSRVLEHYPTGPSDYTDRTSPLECLPLAAWYRNAYCAVGHWKHQLLRMRGAGDLMPLHGHHTAAADDGRRVREHADSLLMHHFPWRNRDQTEARLRRLGSAEGRYATSPDGFLMARLAQRMRMLDHIYDGRFDLVPNPFPGERKLGLDVRHWRDLVSGGEVARMM